MYNKKQERDDRMIYPKFLKDNSTIGVCAPSDGCCDKVDKTRLKNAVNKLIDKGYHVRVTDNCKNSVNGRSTDNITRAREFENLLLDSDVDAIICLSGGEFLMEMLSVLRYDIIWNNPKWIQGYSDPTGLLFTITTNLRIATIYSSNFKTFSMQDWHESLNNNFEILKGNIITQNSFDFYERNKVNDNEPHEIYNLDTKVLWKSINNNEVNMKGRLIGGCLDVLLNIVGTRFDKTSSFLESYKNDGFIWYFDIFDKTNEEIIRALWQLKEAGWFKYINGVIFGRLIEEKKYLNISFRDTIENSFQEFDIPILYDLDFGHVAPRMTLINGAIAEVNYKNGTGNINMYLEK